jgi:putative FmdB family regulatory protein
MPLYEYWCKDCGKTFTELKSVQELNNVFKCPDCNSKRTQRVLSTFATSGQIRAGSRGLASLNRSNCKPTGG